MTKSKKIKERENDDTRKIKFIDEQQIKVVCSPTHLPIKVVGFEYEGEPFKDTITIVAGGGFEGVLPMLKLEEL